MNKKLRNNWKPYYERRIDDLKEEIFIWRLLCISIICVVAVTHFGG